MTSKIKLITSYQHLQLFINEPDLSDTISSSMHRDEYSASVMLWGLNKSTLQKEVKRCANKMFQILSATKNNDEHAILIPIELLSHPKFMKLREKLFNKYKCSKIYRIPKLKIHTDIGGLIKISDCAIIKIRKDITSFQVISFIKCMLKIFGNIDYDVYKHMVSIVKHRFLHQSGSIDYSQLEYFDDRINITEHKTLLNISNRLFVNHIDKLDN